MSREATEPSEVLRSYVTEYTCRAGNIRLLQLLCDICLAVEGEGGGAVLRARFSYAVCFRRLPTSFLL